MKNSNLNLGIEMGYKIW